MNGKFYYTNNAVMIIVTIVGVVGGGVFASCLQFRYGIDGKAMVVLFVPFIFILILALPKIPCSYSAESDTIVIRKGFITQRINTSDIISFRNENRKNGHSRNGGTFFCTC